MNLLLLVIVYSLVGGILSTLGGVILLWRERLMERMSVYLMSFAAGTLLGAAFLDLLPEALEAGEKAGLEARSIAFYALLGFITFFVIEGILFHLHHHGHAGHEQIEAVTPRRSAPWLIVFGDSVHNFIDGIAITAAFLANVPLGITTAFAVAAHEVPQEISDFSIMLRGGWEKKKVLLGNLIPALMTTVGALVALSLRAVIEPALGVLLALATGFFIYISASDLVPELQHLTRRETMTRTFPPFFVGMIVVYILARLVEG